MSLARMIMGQPPPSVTLLARSQARSDDAEVDSLEQPLVAPAVHPFTGTFAASDTSELRVAQDHVPLCHV